MYYTLEIIEYIVQMINLNPQEPKDPEHPRAHATDWQLTSTGEIYTYFAIHIYMTLHLKNELADY